MVYDQTLFHIYDLQILVVFVPPNKCEGLRFESQHVLSTCVKTLNTKQIGLSVSSSITYDKNSPNTIITSITKKELQAFDRVKMNKNLVRRRFFYAK